MADTEKTITPNPLGREAKGSTNNPSVFISYAWGDADHKEKVRLFADRLTINGVRVMLDQYDLQPGQDLNVFMENCVTNSEIDYVLIIADEIYAKKADERTGGVGSETQLISAEVYQKVQQTKFIPLVFEKDRNGKAFLPAYIKSRNNIDLSDDATYEAEFHTLLRHLWGEPELKKPPLGKKPVFETVQKETLIQVAGNIDKHVDKVTVSDDVKPRSVSEILSDLSSLRSLPDTQEPRDERVWEAISKMKPYRDEILQNVEQMIIDSKHSKVKTQDVEEVITEVLTVLEEYTYPPPGVSQWGSYDYDHFSFLVTEMVIQFMALLIKYRRYELIGRLTSKTYFYTTNTGEQRYGTYEEFRHYIEHLDQQRNRRLELKRVSVTADLLKERADYSTIGFTELRNADILLYLISRIIHPEMHWWWFPSLSVYYDRGAVIPLGELVSKERAVQIIKMFGCTNIDDFQEKLKLAIEVAAQRPSGFSSFEYNIPNLSRVFPDKIASVE